MELKRVPLFKGLPENELRVIARDLTPVDHPAGRRFMTRGRDGVGFMVILEGEIEAQFPSGDTLRMGPGDHLGEMALLDHQGRGANVVAVTDVHVAALPSWAFKSFLSAHPEVAYRMLQVMSLRLREARQARQPLTRRKRS